MRRLRVLLAKKRAARRGARVNAGGHGWMKSVTPPRDGTRPSGPPRRKS